MLITGSFPLSLPLPLLLPPSQLLACSSPGFALLSVRLVLSPSTCVRVHSRVRIPQCAPVDILGCLSPLIARRIVCLSVAPVGDPRPLTPMYAAITGRSIHVLADGRRGVLREEMAAYLREDLGLVVAAEAGNNGRLIVRAQALRRWMAGRPPPDS